MKNIILKGLANGEFDYIIIKKLVENGYTENDAKIALDIYKYLP